MAVGGFDWAAFETELTAELRFALAELGKAEAGETFYVVALSGVHRELDGLLSLPMLGAGTVRTAPSDDEGDFWGERWNPCAWAFPRKKLKSSRNSLRLPAPRSRLNKSVTAKMRAVAGWLHATMLLSAN